MLYFTPSITARGHMTLIEIHIPYTTKSKAGIEYKHHKKIVIDEDKANQIAEEERRKQVQHRILK